MIITCPGCEKKYDVAAHIASGKPFYKMRCANCGTHWRLRAEQPETHEQSSPQNRQPNHNHKPPLVVPTEKPKIKTYSAWHDLVAQYSLDWAVLLGAVAVALLIMFYEGQSLSDLSHWPAFFSRDSEQTSSPKEATAKVNELGRSRVPSKPTDTKTPDYQETLNQQSQSSVMSTPASTNMSKEALTIAQVNYVSEEHYGRPRLVVRGNIINGTPETKAAKDLSIIAWGECPLDPENQKDREKMDQGEKTQRCVLTQWIHRLEKTSLTAGETKSFESVAPGNGLSAVKDIEVIWSER